MSYASPMAQAFRRFSTAMSVLMLGTIVSVGITGFAINKATQVSDEVRMNRAHFYSIIAGSESPNSPRDGLAIKLRDTLQASQPGSDLPSNIISFRTVAGGYGGISEYLGYDPFDNLGQSCTECGALSATTQSKLLAIKQGNLQGVLATETAGTSVNTVPASTAIVIAVYFVGGTLLARRSTRGIEGPAHTSGIIEWDAQPGNIKLGYQCMAPLFYLGSKRHYAWFNRMLATQRDMAGLSDVYTTLKVRRKRILELGDDVPSRSRELKKIQELMDGVNAKALEAQTGSEQITDAIIGDVQRELEAQRVRVHELEM